MAGIDWVVGSFSTTHLESRRSTYSAPDDGKTQITIIVFKGDPDADPFTLYSGNYLVLDLMIFSTPPVTISSDPPPPTDGAGRFALGAPPPRFETKYSCSREKVMKAISLAETGRRIRPHGPTWSMSGEFRSAIKARLISPFWLPTLMTMQAYRGTQSGF